MTPFLKDQVDVVLVDPTLLHLQAVVKDMRKADYDEILCTVFEKNLDILAEQMYYTWKAGVVLYAKIVLRADTMEPVGFIMISWITPTACMMHMFGTDDISRVGLMLTKKFKKEIIPNIFKAGIQRGECRTIETYDKVHRWLENIGAKKEAVIPSFGKNGETFFQFVIQNEN